MDELVGVLSRALQRRGASLDPFTLMELATLVRHAASGGGPAGSDAVGSARAFLRDALERSFVEEPERVADDVVREALEYCRREGCG
ncbi:hypothetical protein [Stetteria hydrogenophila]